MRGILLRSGPLDVYRQMALDEVCAGAFAGVCLLRFYEWNGKGVTFGYAQEKAEVDRGLPEKAAGWPSVRRPTGGGIVVHDDDLTFSCVFPAPGGFRPGRVYAEMHGALCKELSACGVAAELKSGAVPASAYSPSNAGAASACFANPVPQDLIDESGGKILGGALRRYENSVLYQGSLQTKGARSRADELKAAIAAGLAGLWG
ncbi:MAG: hypothetical protein GX410_09990, partial [Elusimicrobia bacterium]|nr:hypothetical protein [Elusimicrobiota bacterium]